MTVSTQTQKVNHAGTGTQTVFPYNFRILDATHMKVLIDDVEQATGWTVDGVGNQTGGDVTFTMAPTDGVVVTLYRLVPLTQLIDYQPQDAFPSETHELGFDKITMMIQQLQEAALRSINLPVSDDGTTSVVFPSYSPGDNIGWCDATKEICNIPQVVCPPAYVDPYHEMIGQISGDGSTTKSGAVGFTSDKRGGEAGKYEVVFDTAITETYVVVVGKVGTAGNTAYTISETNTGFQVDCRDDEDGDYQDSAWSFHLVWETA